MPHRGRLNMLVQRHGQALHRAVLRVPGRPSQPEDVQGSGDVKYHLGTSTDREIAGTTVHLSLPPNPSHLEAVDPVVLGKVRAKQDQRGDAERSQVMAILMHGDAAFAGQGLVAESLDLAELSGYRTGGTIHIIVNNQIGFTTLPAHARSGPYCTDVAKIVQAPILHVNGDDPEAVVHVARIAAEFRQQFKRDIVIDMFCYRRHGHNEADEPAFTQPLMYREIGSHPTARQLYAERLDAEGVRDARPTSQAMMREFRAEARQGVRGGRPTTGRTRPTGWKAHWTGLARSRRARRTARATPPCDSTSCARSAARCSEPPRTSTSTARSRASSQAKRKMIESGEGIDWATGEALAFGTLLVEGTPVRLSGQDSGRGTFSQRHAVLVDQTNESDTCRSTTCADGQAQFEVIDSPLSEAGVLGFEYGYSPGRSQCAGAVGGAVRRLRQRRAGHHRPVHLLGREQVAAHVRPGDAAAARL